MRLINSSELHNIYGAAATPSDFMCVYSLIQYQNLRGTMLNHAYQGYTAEDTDTSFNRDKESFEMYRSWTDTYCPRGRVAEFT